MYQNFLSNTSFHLFLNQLDQSLAEQIQQQGCPYCLGTLHGADYPRSPLGVSAFFRNYYQSRLSFCCSQCRRRTTSPSVRFFGRRWFPAPIFLLIATLVRGANEQRCALVKRHFGVVISETTWKRWRCWWRDAFIESKFWQQVKGTLPPIPELIHGPFPRVLLKLFQQPTLKNKIVHLLQFLSPLTIGLFHTI